MQKFWGLISLFHCQKEVKHLFRESHGKSTKPQPKLKNNMVARILGFEPRHSGSDVLKLFDVEKVLGVGRRAENTVTRVKNGLRCQGKR